MFLPARSRGIRLTWSIGGDNHPVRTTSEPHTGQDDRGRLAQMVEVIVFRPTADGSRTYLGRQIVNSFWLKPRTTLVPELDGTPGDPKPLDALLAEQEASYNAYRSTQTSATDLSSVLARLQAPAS